MIGMSVAVPSSTFDMGLPGVSIIGRPSTTRITVIIVVAAAAAEGLEIEDAGITATTTMMIIGR